MICHYWCTLTNHNGAHWACHDHTRLPWPQVSIGTECQELGVREELRESPSLWFLSELTLALLGLGPTTCVFILGINGRLTATKVAAVLRISPSISFSIVSRTLCFQRLEMLRKFLMHLRLRTTRLLNIVVSQRSQVPGSWLCQSDTWRSWESGGG